MVTTSLFLAAALAQLIEPVKWHTSVEEARAAAVREKKLLFVYHLVGDLDKEKC